MKYYFVIILVGVILIPSCMVSELLSRKKSPEQYLWDGRTQMNLTDTYAAIKSFTRAIKLNPDYIEAYTERAKANMTVDSIDNAIRDYDSLLVKIKTADYSKLGEIYFLKGDALYLLSKDSASCACYRKAKDLNNITSWDRIRKRCK